LNEARAVRSGDLPEIHRSQVRRNIRVLRLVERVLHVRFELERLAFCDREVLPNRNVQIAVSGGSQRELLSCPRRAVRPEAVTTGNCTKADRFRLLQVSKTAATPSDYETLSQQTVEIKRMLTVLVQKLTAES
jgi:hypothetical protein